MNDILFQCNCFLIYWKTLLEQYSLTTICSESTRNLPPSYVITHNFTVVVATNQWLISQDDISDVVAVHWLRLLISDCMKLSAIDTVGSEGSRTGGIVERCRDRIWQMNVQISTLKHTYQRLLFWLKSNFMGEICKVCYCSSTQVDVRKVESRDVECDDMIGLHQLNQIAGTTTGKLALDSSRLQPRKWAHGRKLRPPSPLIGKTYNWVMPSTSGCEMREEVKV